MASRICPTMFVSHGGGPCFWMNWDPPHLFNGLRSYFESLPGQLSLHPSAIVVISAHWEEPIFKIQSSTAPTMIYDYYGFPQHTYTLSYPAPGSPQLAVKISQLLNINSIEHDLDTQRGFDHGVYVPLLISYPQASIPVLQISLRSDLNPLAHFELGQALKPLRDENVLILGSGFSYHNLGAIPDRHGVSQAFDQWLCETLFLHNPNERKQRLLDWSSAPQARLAHPREEHLIPLLVCAGAAATEDCIQTYSEKLPGWDIQTSCFKFG